MASPRHPLVEAAERFPDAIAIVNRDQTCTYRQYYGRAAGFAAGLNASLRPGAAVGMSLPPSADYAALIMACTMAGIVAAPLDAKLPPEGLAAALRALGARALITSKPEDAPRGMKILMPERGTDASVRDRAKQGTDPSRSKTPSLASVPCFAIMTSGSTGTPKAVVLSLGNLCANAAASNRIIPVAPADRWLLSLPLYHVSGLGILFRCLLAGGTVVIPDDAGLIPAAVKEHSVTHVSLVATQLFRLFEMPEATEALRGLKAILLGGSAIPEALIRRAIESGLPVQRSYGLSEMASQVATTRADDPAEALFTSGKPLDPEAVTLARDGEILVRGPCLFQGCLADGRLEPPATTDGWFATGDLGEWDAHGNLLVRGRKDNRFVSGGENIQPEEIERHLQAMDGVLDAIVVPVADAEFGERPVAFVRIEGALDPKALLTTLATRLPRFKLPKVVLPWPEAASGGGMKVSRAELAEAAARQCGIQK